MCSPTPTRLDSTTSAAYSKTSSTSPLPTCGMPSGLVPLPWGIKWWHGTVKSLWVSRPVKSLWVSRPVKSLCGSAGPGLCTVSVKSAYSHGAVNAHACAHLHGMSSHSAYISIHVCTHVLRMSIHRPDHRGGILELRLARDVQELPRGYA